MIIFIIVWLIWFLSEILLNRLFRSKTEIKEDRGSLKIIWLAITASIILGVFFAVFTKFKISNFGILQYFGLLLILLGMILRFFAVFTLGRFFTVDVSLNYNHKLKKDGFYRIIRHPSYTGSLISFFGFGLSLNNWISLIVIILLVFPSFLYRIKVEENFLLKHFGEEFLNYKQKTYFLIPWLY